MADFSSATRRRKDFRIVTPHQVLKGTIGGPCTPEADYMKNWTPAQISRYCAKLGWRLEWYEEI